MTAPTRHRTPADVRRQAERLRRVEADLLAIAADYAADVDVPQEMDDATAAVHAAVAAVTRAAEHLPRRKAHPKTVAEGGLAAIVPSANGSAVSNAADLSGVGLPASAPGPGPSRLGAGVAPTSAVLPPVIWRGPDGLPQGVPAREVAAALAERPARGPRRWWSGPMAALGWWLGRACAVLAGRSVAW